MDGFNQGVRRLAAASVLLALAGLPPKVAEAQGTYPTPAGSPLIGNLSKPDGRHHATLGQAAQMFWTGGEARGYYLAGVVLSIADAGWIVKVTIRKNTSRNTPGATVYSFTDHPITVGDGLREYRVPANAKVKLKPNTKYHIVARRSGGSRNRIWKEASVPDKDSGSAPGWIFGADKLIDQDGWVSSSDPLKFQVRGTVVPSPPTLTMTSVHSTGGIVEGESASFTVARTGDTDESLLFKYSVSETGDMLDANHGTSGAVSIPSGESEVTFEVPTYDDDVGEVDSTLTVELEPPSSSTDDYLGAGSFNGLARVRVRDNDGGLPKVTVERVASPVTEGGQAQFQVRRTGSSSGALTVNYRVSESGHMVASSHEGDKSISFASGVAAKTVGVPTEDDGAIEEDSEVTLTLRMGSGYELGSDGSATVTVEDDDDSKPRVTVTAERSLAIENEGEIRFTVARTGDTGESLTVRLAVTETGTMAHPNQLGSRSVAIPSGSSDETFTVTIHNDGVQEADSVVTLALTADAAYILGSPSSASVRVQDDDEPSKSTVTVTARKSSAREGPDAAIHFSFARAGNTSEPLLVRYDLTETGSMIYPNQLGSKVAEFSSGHSGSGVTLTIWDDGTAEAASVVTLALREDPAYILGSPSSATVTVEDDDGRERPTLTLQRVSNSVQEGASARFKLRRTGDVGHRLRVRYRVSESGAMASPGHLGAKEIELGSGKASVDLDVPTVNDQTEEADSVVTLALRADPAYALGSPSSATVTVKDDDNSDSSTGSLLIGNLSTPDGGDHVSLGRAAQKFFTGDAPGGYNLASVVLAIGEPGWTVKVAIQKDTSRNTPGDTVYRFTNYPIKVGDGLWEYRVPGHVNVKLDRSTPYHVVARRTLGNKVRIWKEGSAGEYSGGAPGWGIESHKRIDQDGWTANSDPLKIQVRGTVAATPPTLTIRRGTNPIVEGEGASFTVERTGGTSESLLFNYSVSETGDMLDANHGTGGAVRIPSLESEATFAVPTYDDDVREADSVLTVALAADAAYELGSPSSASVTVEDDDGPSKPTLTLEPVSSPVEEGSAATFTVTRSGGTAGALTVNYSVSESGDVVAAGEEGAKSIAFADGAASVAITVLTEEDSARGDGGTVTVALTADASYVLGSPSMATVTVEDDDGAKPTISNTTPAVGDTLTADASGVADADGLANPAFSYQWIRVSGGSEANISGATSASYTVAAEDVGATLKVAVSYVAGGDVPETITIESAETAVVPVPSGLSLSDADVIEGDTGETELAFTVSLAPPATGAVTVDWATSDGTATAGTDYAAGIGSLAFDVGDSSRTVTVAVLGDVRSEPDETFQVTLSNPSGAAILDGAATGTIRDDDPPALMLILTPDVIRRNGGTSTVAAVLTRPLEEDAALTVSAAPVPPTAAADYALGANRELTIPAGETSSLGLVTITAAERGAQAPNGQVRVSATVADGIGVEDPRSVTLTIIDAAQVPFLPPAAAPGLEGFVRILNHSDEAGEVAIEAIDDAGVSAGVVTLPIAANAARHLNAADLEGGNPAKGVAQGVGAGQGGWRLVLKSALPFTALTYVRAAGVVTPMHDAAPAVGDSSHVAFFNPASNLDQISSLRLVNLGGLEAAVTVVGTDGAGVTPEAAASVAVPAGGAAELTADGLEGALGAGQGKWRLAVRSPEPVLAMSLLASPTGHLTNLSTVPARSGDGGAHVVPLFLSASDAFGRQGFVRVANRSAQAGQVTITAHDDSEFAYEPVTLAIGAGATAHFNSDDLELGNAAKGLTGGTGSGVGDWRLELTSGLDLDVLAYVRTSDGFLTSVHDVAPTLDGGAYWVAFFNPAANQSQVSSLRLVNPGAADARVTVTGIDDRGASPGGAVVLTVPAGASRTLGAAELESGAAGLHGALGDGSGKWRLRVVSDQPLLVMSLLAGPEGHLTNLSSAPARGLR